MPDRVWTTIFLPTTLIFRYHLPGGVLLSYIAIKYHHTTTEESTENTECQAFYPVVRIGSPIPSPARECCSHKGEDTLARGLGIGGTQFRRWERHNCTLVILKSLYGWKGMGAGGVTPSPPSSAISFMDDGNGTGCVIGNEY